MEKRRAELTNDQMDDAYWMWRYLNYHFKEADDAIDPFLSLKTQTSGRIPWLRTSRTALFLSMKSVAEKAGISAKTYQALESNETKGTVTLASLEKAANAMGCELIYSIRPKGGKRYSHVIWEQLLEHSLNHAQVIHAGDVFKARTLAGIAKIRMEDLWIRKRLGWSKLAEDQSPERQKAKKKKRGSSPRRRVEGTTKPPSVTKTKHHLEDHFSATRSQRLESTTAE
jgi:transcriptional regulator with XRE-family HTH domain